MSITVSKYPALIAGVRNPVVFEMSSEHYITGEFAAIQMMYQGDENLGANYTLDMYEIPKTILFSCVLNPDNSGTQFPTRQGESMEEWIDIVCYYMSLNAELTSIFSILPMPQEHIIRFEAKERGYRYSPSLSVGGSILAIHDVKITMGADDQEKLDQMIGLQVWRQIDGENAMISEDLSAGRIIDNNLIVQFNIAEILAAHCVSEVNTLASPFFQFTQRNKMNPAYLIKYYEQIEGVIVEVFTSRWFFSLNGGVPAWRQLPFLRDYDNLQNYFLITRRYFLTWCDFPKQTDVDAPERLYLLFPTKPTSTNFVLRITKHFNDDGDEITDIPVHKTIYAGEIFELDVSVKKLFVTKPANLSGYDVQFLAQDNSFYSSVFQFTIDTVYHQYVRYFVFKNSLGAFEGVRFFGSSDLELTFKRETFEQSVLQEYTQGYLPVSQKNPDITRTRKLNSGYQCTRYIEWLEDFLQSDQVYEVQGETWYPVVITQDKVTISKDAKASQKISINVEYPDHPAIYQPETTTPWSTVNEIGNPYI